MQTLIKYVVPDYKKFAYIVYTSKLFLGNRNAQGVFIFVIGLHCSAVQWKFELNEGLGFLLRN